MVEVKNLGKKILFIINLGRIKQIARDKCSPKGRLQPPQPLPKIRLWTTEYCDSVRLSRDHNGSLGTMATKYNNSLRLIRDHNESLSRMAIEYYWKNPRNDIVWLICKLFVHHYVL